MAARVLAQELMKYEDDETLPFTIDAEGDDITQLRVTLTPPEGTPYEGGIFFLSLSVPSQYPSSPPNIKFETKIYHPNINEEGKICLEQLKSDWKPNYTLKHAIEFIYYLLEHPNWDNPLVSAIGTQHANSEADFIKTAKEWTEKFAV